MSAQETLTAAMIEAGREASRQAARRRGGGLGNWLDERELRPIWEAMEAARRAMPPGDEGRGGDIPKPVAMPAYRFQDDPSLRGVTSQVVGTVLVKDVVLPINMAPPSAAEALGHFFDDLVGDLDEATEAGRTHFQSAIGSRWDRKVRCFQAALRAAALADAQGGRDEEPPALGRGSGVPQLT